MKTTTRAVVIGGGIAGCSALYHLTQEGWTDVVLIERDELTSGTTWHSAAQVTNFGAIQVMVGLKKHSIRLYRELADDPDYPINYNHGDGGLRLASEEWHLDGYRHFISMAKGMGVEYELLDAPESARRHPLISTDGLAGALWDGEDGDIDPAQLCQALARRARKAGAEVYRHTPVTGIKQRPDDSWTVQTTKGDIDCEVVINAGGYRCNEIGAMMGVSHPVVSMEHQYFVTEAIPELEALDHRVPLLRCPTDDFYSRQDKKGLLLGFYEQDCKTWGTDGIDPDFTNALCPDDLDRIMPVLENVFKRVPSAAEVGIHTIVNGPITYTPDGVPLVGKIPGKRNAYCITGLRAGVGEGGGHGWLLAQMIVHGEAEYDTWALDPRRFGDWADQDYTTAKVVEDYQNEFRFHQPHEQRPAGRNMRKTPLYDRLKSEGAQFGVVNGWERALCFAPDGFKEQPGFGFTNAHDIIGSEVATIQNAVGIAEVSGFNRYEITGDGALDWLDSVVCSRVPRKSGKIALVYALNHDGGIKTEATLAHLPDGRIWWGSAAAAELHDMDWLKEASPPEGVTIKPLTDTHTILVVAGPKSGDTLSAALPQMDWTYQWLVAQPVPDTGIIAMAVSFSGERAWELHIPNDALVKTYDALRKAGAEPFGLYATESMRLEKGYRHWKADLITEFRMDESNLGRFVKKDGAYIGADALKDATPRRMFVSMILDTEAYPAHPGDSIMDDGKVIGTVTSAGWGHRTRKNIAMGFVDPGYDTLGKALMVDAHGALNTATVCEPCLYDPENTLLRQR
jgi:dimethylglycine dehydrogenase